MNLKRTALLTTSALLLMGATVPASAARMDIGYDWASYQGAYGVQSRSDAKFAFSKLGGDGMSYINPFYKTQVQSGIASGLRMHTYVWFQDIVTYSQVDTYMAYYLPMVQTPKGSIVALDVEAGAQNTAAIMYAMQKIKDAGYTPMLYSGRPFMAEKGINHELIGKTFGKFSIWIASYPTSQVGVGPLWNYFPSMNNIGIWQYSDRGLAQGLDMNVDVSGDKNWSITENGYKNGNAEKPKTRPDAVEQGEKAKDTSNKDIKKGMTVKINPSAKNYVGGPAIPKSIKGVGYKVIQVEKNKVLLGGINSWVNKKDVEILNANKTENKVSFNGVYVVDSWQVYGNKWYACNNDMSIPVADYHNDIPVGAVTLTDRYGNKLRNQTAQGNNGRMEFFTLEGKHKVIQRQGNAINVLIGGESVWLKSVYAK